MKSNILRRALLLSLIVAGTLGGMRMLSGAMTPQSSADGTATVMLDRDSHILIDAGLRQEWKVPFRITNVGSRRLVVTEIDAKCNCGEAAGGTVVISPGQSTSLIVTLDTRHTPREATAVFVTNDPTRPNFRLTVRSGQDR